MKRVKIFDLGASSGASASKPTPTLERMAEHMKSLTKEDCLRVADAMRPSSPPKPSDPALDYLLKRGVPRERWAIEYLRVTHGHIPESITAEELGEVVPAELADEIALLYFDDLGAIHFDIEGRVQKSTKVQ